MKIKFTAVRLYLKNLAKQLCCCLQQHGVRSVFKSNTTQRLHLVQSNSLVFRSVCRLELLSF